MFEHLSVDIGWGDYEYPDVIEMLAVADWRNHLPNIIILSLYFSTRTWFVNSRHFHCDGKTSIRNKLRQSSVHNIYPTSIRIRNSGSKSSLFGRKRLLAEWIAIKDYGVLYRWIRCYRVMIWSNQEICTMRQIRWKMWCLFTVHISVICSMHWSHWYEYVTKRILQNSGFAFTQF